MDDIDDILKKEEVVNDILKNFQNQRRVEGIGQLLKPKKPLNVKTRKEVKFSLYVTDKELQRIEYLCKELRLHEDDEHSNALAEFCEGLQEQNHERESLPWIYPNIVKNLVVPTERLEFNFYATDDEREELRRISEHDNDGLIKLCEKLQKERPLSQYVEPQQQTRSSNEERVSQPPSRSSSISQPVDSTRTSSILGNIKNKTNDELKKIALYKEKNGLMSRNSILALQELSVRALPKGDFEKIVKEHILTNKGAPHPILMSHKSFDITPDGFKNVFFRKDDEDIYILKSGSATSEEKFYCDLMEEFHNKSEINVVNDYSYNRKGVEKAVTNSLRGDEDIWENFRISGLSYHEMDQRDSKLEEFKRKDESFRKKAAALNYEQQEFDRRIMDFRAGIPNIIFSKNSGKHMENVGPRDIENYIDNNFNKAVSKEFNIDFCNNLLENFKKLKGYLQDYREVRNRGSTLEKMGMLIPNYYYDCSNFVNININEQIEKLEETSKKLKGFYDEKIKEMDDRRAAAIMEQEKAKAEQLRKQEDEEKARLEAIKKAELEKIKEQERIQREADEKLRRAEIERKQEIVRKNKEKEEQERIREEQERLKEEQEKLKKEQTKKKEEQEEQIRLKEEKQKKEVEKAQMDAIEIEKINKELAKVNKEIELLDERGKLYATHIKDMLEYDMKNDIVKQERQNKLNNEIKKDPSKMFKIENGDFVPTLEKTPNKYLPFGYYDITPPHLKNVKIIFRDANERSFLKTSYSDIINNGKNDIAVLTNEGGITDEEQSFLDKISKLQENGLFPLENRGVFAHDWPSVISKEYTHHNDRKMEEIKENNTFRFEPDSSENPPHYKSYDPSKESLREKVFEYAFKGDLFCEEQQAQSNELGKKVLELKKAKVKLAEKERDMCTRRKTIKFSRKHYKDNNKNKKDRGSR